jgi:hypothetical protein
MTGGRKGKMLWLFESRREEEENAESVRNVGVVI